MSSMNDNILDKIVRADFSSETNFKDVLRKRLFESASNKKSGILQFQRLSDMELDMVSAAGDMNLLRQQEEKKNGDRNILEVLIGRQESCSTKTGAAAFLASKRFFVVIRSRSWNNEKAQKVLRNRI